MLNLKRTDTSAMTGLLVSGKHVDVELDVLCPENTIILLLFFFYDVRLGQYPVFKYSLCAFRFVYTCIGLPLWEKGFVWAMGYREELWCGLL